MFDKKNNKKEKSQEIENTEDLEVENEKTDEQEKEENKQADETQENKVKELEEENKKLKETLMRTLAELDNTRKRSIEENEKTAKYAISKFAEDLIPVMEDFYLAFENVKHEDLCDNTVAKNFFEGITLTQNELKKVFDKNGLSRIFPLNEDFNPDFHNAITQIETEENEDGKVVQVMQAGYKIKDRLLRPALVAVSKSKTK